MLLLTISSVFAGEIGRPEWFVKSIIEDCINNKNIDSLVDFYRLSSHPKHAISKETFISKLKKLKLSQIKFYENPKNLGEIIDKNHITTVRMLSPINIDFELELRETGIDVKPYKWILVSIHP